MVKLQPFLQPFHPYSLLPFPFSGFIIHQNTSSDDYQTCCFRHTSTTISSLQLQFTQTCCIVCRFTGIHSNNLPYNSLRCVNYLIIYGPLKTDPALHLVLLEVKIFFHHEATKCCSRQAVEGISFSPCHHHRN